MPQDIVQVASDALALGNFRQMLDFFLRLKQFLVGAVTLREMNIADPDHEGEAACGYEEPAVEMKRPPRKKRRGLDRRQNLEPVDFVVNDKRSASRGKDEEG